MKKNLFATMACFAVVALMVGCGGGDAPAPSESVATGDASTPPAAPAGDVGSIAGKVSYINGDPDAVIGMDADPVCSSLHEGEVHTEKVVTNDAGDLANVFVYVKEGLAGDFTAPGDSHLLDQMGCQYSPHVSGVMVGQTLVIKNSDPTLHNVHAIPTENKEFNQGQPFQGMELEHTFDKPEVMVRFKCDVHPWMASYMAVLEHPFFGVTGDDGAFDIVDLPVGDYVLEAWHEEFGTQTQNITVGANEVISVSFDFSPGDEPAG